jgi:hypothetical protein
MKTLVVVGVAAFLEGCANDVPDHVYQNTPAGWG